MAAACIFTGKAILPYDRNPLTPLENAARVLKMFTCV